MITISNIVSVHDPLTDEVVGIEFNLCNDDPQNSYDDDSCYCTDQSLLEGVRISSFPIKYPPPSWNFKSVEGEPITCESNKESLNLVAKQILDRITENNLSAIASLNKPKTILQKFGEQLKNSIKRKESVIASIYPKSNENLTLWMERNGKTAITMEYQIQEYKSVLLDIENGIELSQIRDRYINKLTSYTRNIATTNGNIFIEYSEVIKVQILSEIIELLAEK